MDFFHGYKAMRAAAEAAKAEEEVKRNNAAAFRKRIGEYQDALRVYTETVEAIVQDKVRLHGEHSIQAAISFNSLGRTYLVVGRLDDAADAFTKALVVRDDKAFGGMELGPRKEAAASREYMARVLEARGGFSGARGLRLKGADKGHTMCGCEEVSLVLVVVPTTVAENSLCENSAKSLVFVNYSACPQEVPCCPAHS